MGRDQPPNTLNLGGADLASAIGKLALHGRQDRRGKKGTQVPERFFPDFFFIALAASGRRGNRSPHGRGLRALRVAVPQQ
jgi:hypothetical protein